MKYLILSVTLFLVAPTVHAETARGNCSGNYEECGTLENSCLAEAIKSANVAADNKCLYAGHLQVGELAVTDVKSEKKFDGVATYFWDCTANVRFACH